MTEIKGAQLTGTDIDPDTEDEGQDEDDRDRALEALTALSQAAEKGVAGLNEVSEDLATMEEHRRNGWSWQRIATATPQLLPTMAGTVKDLGRASGQFRRSLAHSLRHEGMNVTEIAALLQVTRQRIGALLRPRKAG